MVQNVVKLLRHFILNRNIFSNIKQQYKLASTLKPYFKARLLNHRTSVIYLFSYLSGAFTVSKKRQILDHHYQYLKNVLPPTQLQTLFKQGISCYQDSTTADEYNILLASTHMLEFEGSLSLSLLVNNIKIAMLSFSIAPGVAFDLPDEQVIYMANMQRWGEHNEDIHKATKYFNDIIPATILLKTIEALASVLSISTAIGISANNQLTAIIKNDHERFYSIYDQFWLNHGGELKNGDYIIPLPLVQKPIEQVKQTHRNRTLKKRERLKGIYEEACRNLSSVFHKR
ncbi:DUF535 family protein [Mucilaginibacter sp. CAU 1740]|uniref:DUF535 family protein n=1 Tax=Mucilaginibacter sp. CAU 1740 TaxID=3140365 RepID=UPI00325AB020